MSEPYTVGQYLVDRLEQLGLGHLFSIAGDYSIAWVNTYVETSSIRVIEEVNELNAGYAADGYARLKGIGALCVTYSAGALCAVNAIAGSYVEKVPVVLINGTPSIKKTITFEQTGFISHHFITGRETDLQSFQHLTVAAIRIDNPDLAPMLIDYALTRCITERRPIYVELLEDMVDLACRPPSGSLEPARSLSDPCNLSASVEAVRSRLEAAANPLLWVGVEVDRFGLHQDMKDLIQQLQIPFVTELLSKSVLSEDDPLFAGVFDGRSSSQAVQDLMKKADFILAPGVWLTDINALGWTFDFDKMALASFDSVKLGTSLNAQVSLKDFIGGLSATEVRCGSRPGFEKPVPTTVAFGPQDEISYQGFYDFVQKFVDLKTIVASDASLNYFGSLLLKVPGPTGFVVQSSYSAIGYAAAAASGLCLAKQGEQRVVVFTGDGGFQMTAQCLSTQTRFNLDPIHFVIDNGIYGVEQWLADASVFQPGHADKPLYKSCMLHPWNYSKLAEVFGCRGWKATTYAELESAVTGALANTASPSVIQVVVPRRSIPTNALWKDAEK